MPDNKKKNQSFADKIAAALEAAGGVPDAGGTTNDPYVFPYDVAEGTTVQNRSVLLGGTEGRRTAPRYRYSDLTAPLAWSPEKVAQLQKKMVAVGLYGPKTKVKLGFWQEQDVKAWTEVLSASNIEGRTWFEQLGEWTKRPPVDLLSKIRGGGDGTQAPIRLTNPMDIQTGARRTASAMLGQGDQQFVESAVSGFQAQERAAGQASNAATAEGTGSEIVNEPSLEGYLENKVLTERPVESSGYRLLGHYNAVLQRLGLAG